MWVTDFNAKYDTSYNHVSVIKNQKHPAWIRTRKVKGRKVPTLDVNVGYLERVEDFRMNLTDEAQELYYEGVDKYKTCYGLAREIAKRSDKTHANWSDWLTNRLFRSRNERFTILNASVAKRMVTFVRIMRRIKDD